MKKIICFFIILSQSFLFLSYAADEAVSTENQAATQESVSSPAAVEATNEAPLPVVEKKKAKPAVVKEEVKEPVATEEVKTEELGPASQEIESTVVLRERISDQNPLRKVARGAVNATLGWVEIPRQMMKENKTKGDIAGVFWGPLKGFAFFVGRTAVGIYEVTTFLIPPYKPVVNPEFILSEDDD
jgi:putative exosortase-associated protein (TIGR04073 family)